MFKPRHVAMSLHNLSTFVFIKFKRISCLGMWLVDLDSTTTPGNRGKFKVKYSRINVLEDLYFRSTNDAGFELPVLNTDPILYH